MESNPVLAERVGDGDKQKWSREATVSTARWGSTEGEKAADWVLRNMGAGFLCFCESLHQHWLTG